MSAPAVRRLAPFGRDVQQAMAGGHTCNVFLFACRPDPWKRANARRTACGPSSALVLPPGEDPESFRWPPLPDLVADITGLGADETRRLAHALVRDGVLLAYLLDAEHHERDLRVVATIGTGGAP
jgi:hypothetical protein